MDKKVADKCIEYLERRFRQTFFVKDMELKSKITKEGMITEIYSGGKFYGTSIIDAKDVKLLCDPMLRLEKMYNQ